MIISDNEMSKAADLNAIFERDTVLTRLAALSKSPDKPEARRAKLLAEVKAVYTRGRKEIARRFYEGADGLEDARAQTFLMDELIRVLFNHFVTDSRPAKKDAPDSGKGLAVIAVGGYGRGDLAPFSDIDILFAIADSKDKPLPGQYAKATSLANRKTRDGKAYQQIIQEILYILWDLGLKLGHATRTICDNLRMAKADMTVRTGLLESRFVAGDDEIYTQLASRFRGEIVKGSQGGFMAAKLAEREKRHQAVGDSRYLLEPNIKQGKGGLRDLHTLFWIAQYSYAVDDVKELVAQKVLSLAEVRKFAKARNFLMTLRCHLHYAAGRAEERLTFDKQTMIGQRMGYRGRSGRHTVERFMKHYFVVAKEVGDLSRIFLAAMRAEKHPGSLISWRWSSRRRNLPPGFEIEGKWFKAKTASILQEEPINLLGIFAYAHRLNMDIHPTSLRQITRLLSLINQDLREDRQANHLFLTMLSHESHPEKLLSKMSEAGVLGRFIPDFRRIIGQMQYDMYHVYTVDEHTIRAIGILNGIERGKLEEDHPLATREMPAVGMRRALYVALFIHDLGKGRGGDHAHTGAEIARNLAPRLGLDAAETETVVWLVRYHLLMSTIAFRRDIDDPQTIRQFADEVQSMERLRLLLILTIADIRAVGPEVWNAWKATLLRNLYHGAADYLTGGNEKGSRIPTVAAHSSLQATQATQAIPGEEWRLKRFQSLVPPSYWSSQDSAAHSRQSRLVNDALDQDGLSDTGFCFASHTDPERDVTEITIYTEDRPGLFALITGALTLAGGDIVDARIYTLTNGRVLDVLSVQDSVDWRLNPGSRLPFGDQEKIRAFGQYLTKSLAGKFPLAAKIAERLPVISSRRDVFSLPPRVHIDNTLSHTATVIEVVGRNRPGLLFALADELGQANLQIASAKISTYGERAVDVFYVKDGFGFKVTASSRITDIQKTLLTLFGDELSGNEESPPGQDKGHSDDTAAMLRRSHLMAKAKRRSLARMSEKWVRWP